MGWVHQWRWQQNSSTAVHTGGERCKRCKAERKVELLLSETLLDVHAKAHQQGPHRSSGTEQNWTGLQEIRFDNKHSLENDERWGKWRPQVVGTESVIVSIIYWVCVNGWQKIGMCGLFLCCLVSQLVDLRARNENFCSMISDEKLVKTNCLLDCWKGALLASNIVSHIILFLYLILTIIFWKRWTKTITSKTASREYTYLSNTRLLRSSTCQCA